MKSWYMISAQNKFILTKYLTSFLALCFFPLEILGSCLTPNDLKCYCDIPCIELLKFIARCLVGTSIVEIHVLQFWEIFIIISLIISLLLSISLSLLQFLLDLISILCLELWIEVFLFFCFFP